MDELVMQCAWCRRRYDSWGVIGEPLASLLAEASHGVCIVCLGKILANRSARHRRDGDPDGARRYERKGGALVRAFLRQDLTDATLDQRRRHRRTRLLLARAARAPSPTPGAAHARDYPFGST